MRPEIMEALETHLKDASIDEILRYLIKESSESEVIACLDMITTESGTRVAAYNWTGLLYPFGENADLTIPPPPWKLGTPDDVTKMIVLEEAANATAEKVETPYKNITLEDPEENDE